MKWVIRGRGIKQKNEQAESRKAAAVPMPTNHTRVQVSRASSIHREAARYAETHAGRLNGAVQGEEVPHTVALGEVILAEEAIQIIYRAQFLKGMNSMIC